MVFETDAASNLDGALLSGTPWGFQFVHRDPGSTGAGWNLTTAVEIPFVD